MRRVVSLSCVLLLLVLGACSDDSGDGGDESADATSTTTEPPAVEIPPTAACASYGDLVGLYAALPDIAKGGATVQKEADARWNASIKDIRAVAPDEDDVQEALDGLVDVSFQVTAEEVPAAIAVPEVKASFVALDEAFGEICAPEVAECPSPEELEAEGQQCDEQGNVTPAD